MQIILHEIEAHMEATAGDALLGWNIADLNFTKGALLGYSSVNSKVSLKVPEYEFSASGISDVLRTLT